VSPAQRGGLPPTQTWLRLQRDWYLDPQLAKACEEVGPAAAAVWCVLLGQACRLDGHFGSRDTLVRAARARDIGLDPQNAEEAVDALLRAGLIEAVGVGFKLSHWTDYEMPESAKTPSQRKSRQTEIRQPSDESMAERGNRETYREKGNAGVPLVTDAEGHEYAVLGPERRRK